HARRGRSEGAQVSGRSLRPPPRFLAAQVGRSGRRDRRRNGKIELVSDPKEQLQIGELMARTIDEPAASGVDDPSVAAEQERMYEALVDFERVVLGEMKRLRGGAPPELQTAIDESN